MISLVLHMTCFKCGKFDTTTSYMQDEIRAAAARAGWLPGLAPPDDGSGTWKDVVVCPDCQKLSEELEEMDFHQDEDVAYLVRIGENVKKTDKKIKE